MTFVKTKHDIGITRQSGTTVGLILARDKDGNKIYEEYDDEYLAVQQTAEAGYDALVPEKEFRIGQESYRSGYGLYMYDSSDPERYHLATDLDMRNKDSVICSYDITAATVPVPHTASDWNDATSAIEGSGATGWASGVANVIDGSTGTYAEFTQDAATSNYIYGYIPAISCSQIRHYKTSVGGTSFTAFAIDLYYNNQWNSVVSGAPSTWGSYVTTALGATYTVTAFRTRVQTTGGGDDFRLHSIQFYATSASIPLPAIEPVDFNDELYFAWGNAIYKLNASGDGFTLVGAVTNTITHLQPFQVSGTDYLFIFLGTGDAYWYMTTAEAFTESTATDKTYQYAAWVVAAADTIYANDGANTIRSTVNPLNGGTAWSAQTIVGEASRNINKLLAFDNLLYIMKEDKPFYIDSSGNVKVLTSITRAVTSTRSGKNSLEWNGNIYMPWDTGALLEYNNADATFAWLNPHNYVTQSASYDGEIMGVAADESWLFAAVDNGSLIEIMCGRYETVNGTTSWVWHPYKELTMTGVNALYITTVYQKGLWIISNTAGEDAQRIPLPLGYGDLTTDSNRDFVSGGAFETPWQHANFKGDNKAFIKLTLTTSNCTSNIYFTAYYKKLGDTAWTTIGNFTTSPRQTRYIPVDASSNNPTSTAIKFRFQATTNSTTTTPILYGWDARGILYPTRRNLIYCEVRCADDIKLNDNTDGRDTGVAEIKATLEELKDTATYPVVFYDIDGATSTVKLLPTGKPFSKVVKMPQREGTKESERRYYLLLQKVPLS